MEVIYKDVTIILKQNLTAAITFHGVLHGFQAGRGMGTATIETKLLQNLTAMREALLFKVFLDLQNTLKRTASLMAVRFWSSLVSMVAVPIPRPA